MDSFKNIEKCKPKVVGSINKFGFSPEHNYFNYLYKQTPEKKCFFFDFGGKRGIIAIFNSKNVVWGVVDGILAPKNERIEVFLNFIDHALSRKNSNKISVEAEEEFKAEVFKALRNSKYKASMNYALHWPVVDVQKLDENLKGKEWKKFRNIRNRFNHLKITVKDPRKMAKQELTRLLFLWLKRRHPRDRVDYSYYLNAIQNNFKGFDMARALFVDNELCSVSAGWKIPNSDAFYCGIGIFNYKYKDIGDFVNLDDLMHIKKMGYRKVDLGGSDKAILHFKKKFKPEKIYKTCIFTVAGKR